MRYQIYEAKSVKYDAQQRDRLNRNREKYAFGKCLAFVLIMLRWWAVARAVPADFPKLSGASSWKQLHNAT